jgi:type IV secretory pathway TraG/TraD family ATPase VirD4
MTDRFYLGLEWNPANGRIGRPVSFDLDDIAHMTLLGPTGSGKGQIEIPNRLWDGLRNVNIIGVDPTGQNRAVTNRGRARFSDREELNPFELHGKDSGCNPMLSVETSDDAMRLAEAVEEVPLAAHEPFWGQSSQGLIGGVILGVVRISKARNETPTLPTVREILTTELEAFAALMEQNGNAQLRSLLARFQKENRTIDAIKLHADNATKWLLSDPIRKSLSVKKGEGIDWKRLKTGPRPLTCDLILPIDFIVTHASWLKVMVVDALNTLYRIGDVKGRKTLFMLSEFASYGRVQPIVTALGAGRKMGIRLAPIVIQDSGQLEAIYGRASATTIIGNSGCLLAFAPAPVDNDTAGFLSQAGGTEWVQSLSASDDPHGGRAHVTVNQHEERIWPEHKIRSLPPFCALAFRSGMAPQPVYCAPYFKGQLDFLIGGRYDADPYHPAGAASSPRRRAGTMTRAAAAAAVIAGGAWLSSATGHGQIWHPHGAPVVQVDPPNNNPPAHAPPHHRATARR